MERFWSKAEITDKGCWEWTAGRRRGGYGVFQFKRNGKWGAFAAHRIAWELSNGTIPTGLIICHRCDNPGCVNPSHLFLGTHRDNTQDMLAKGRAPMMGSGLENPRYQAKLTEGQVMEIRGRWPAETQRALADEYGVGLTTINHILKRRTWTHL